MRLFRLSADFSPCPPEGVALRSARRFVPHSLDDGAMLASFYPMGRLSKSFLKASLMMAIPNERYVPRWDVETYLELRNRLPSRLSR